MNHSRRVLLQSVATGAAGCVAWPAHAKLKAPKRRLQTFGVILGSVSRALNENPLGTLQHLAKQGFKELEFSGPPKGVAAADFMQMISDVGLVPVAGGAAMYQLKTELPKLIENAHLFGHKYVVCYWPWADKGLNKQLADWKQLGGTLNELGATLQKEGLRLAYHNHDIEFAQTEGHIPYDTVLTETDPALVSMELDIYWIYKGGQDAVQYVSRYPGRFALFHVKDRGPRQSLRVFVWAMVIYHLARCLRRCRGNRASGTSFGSAKIHTPPKISWIAPRALRNA